MNWNEKYRAKNLSEIFGQEHVTDVLENISRKIQKDGSDGDLPHLLFYGRPGTGKTNTVIAFLEQTFPEGWEINFREFNASNVTVSELREEVMKLVKSRPIGEFRDAEGNLRPMKLRFIFFDEVDKLTDKSQAILRRLVEKYAADIRWFFTCNDRYRVIEPLRDRCMNFRFRPLRPDALNLMLKKILESEGIKVQEDAIQRIIDRSRGSAREAQNLLFKCYMSGTEVTPELVDRVSDATDREVYIEIFANHIANRDE
ncbi:MAG: AAA family ATPase, partial [Candidatus Thorarchaeota archaeon]